MKPLLGVEFRDYLASCKLQCNTALSTQRMTKKAWQESVNQSYSSFVDQWSLLLQEYPSFVKKSSLHYYEDCSYLIQDSHLSPNGIRRKMMKIPSPHLQYNSREKREEPVIKNEVVTDGCLSLQSPIKYTNYTSLNISTYDCQWGEVSIHDQSILFRKQPKPTDLKGMYVILNTQ